MGISTITGLLMSMSVSDLYQEVGLAAFDAVTKLQVGVVDLIIDTPLEPVMVPTPDPALMQAAIDSSGLEVNNAFVWSAPMLEIGSGYVVVAAGIGIAITILMGARRVAR